MKSFVLYLTIFFVVATTLRGIFGLDRYRFYENPNLKKKLAENKKHKKRATTHKFLNLKKFKFDKATPILEYSSIFGTKLLPIEQKYLQEGIKKHLAKEWFTKTQNRDKYKLVLNIRKHDISTHRYITMHKGKRRYRIDQKSNIRITYKVLNSNGVVVAKAFIPYNVIIKAASYWDFIESERLAKKRLYLIIGEKIANSLNSKRFYIFKH